MSLQKISVLNVSGSAIPSYGVVQCDPTTTLSADGVEPVLNVNFVGTGTGPILIVDEGGLASSTPGSYGNAYRAVQGVVWVNFNGSPPAIWNEVGPVSGHTYMDSTGSGFLYAGLYDATNGLALVMESPYLWKYAKVSSGSAITTATLATGTNFLYDTWIRDPASVTSPPGFIVSPNSGDLGLPGVNRSKGTAAAGTMLKVEKGPGGEWSPKWEDCP